MQEPLDHGNEHAPRRHQDQELLRWVTEEYIAYHGLDEDEQYDYDDEADFSEDHEAGFAQDAAADHQEQHEYGDSAGALYAAAKFPEFRRRSRGLVGGEEWKPPYQRRRFTPVFKRLNPVQPEADLGYAEWIPYHEEEPPMP